MSDQTMEVRLVDISDSPFNRRSHYNKIDELADSMRSKGVLEAVTIRKASKGIKTPFELVFGHRRRRGALKAELETLPAKLRELTDEEVIEFQLIENGQRENPHPLDEADSFADLVERGYTAQQIGDKIGRPGKYVLDRLQLRQLTPACRKALDAEQISLSSALILARIPGAKLQDKALQEATPKWAGDGIMPAKRVAEMVRDRFMLKLAGAPFDRSDVELVPKAGACTVCPKRTGNQAELFDDVKSPDLCTDPTCYRGKLDAHWAIVSKEAKATGQPVLSDKEAKKLLPYHDDQLRYGAEYVELGGHIRSPKTGKEVSVKKLVTKETGITLARSPHTGRVLQLVNRSTVESAMRRGSKAGKGTTKPDTAAARVSAAEKARREREAAKAENQEALLLELMGEASTAAGKKGSTAGVLVHLLEHLLDGEAFGLLLRRRKLQDGPARGYGQELKLRTAFLKDAAHESAAWLWSTIVELLVGELGGMTFGAHPKRFELLVAALGIDRKAAEKRVLERSKAEAAQAAPATKKKPTKKRKAKKS